MTDSHESEDCCLSARGYHRVLKVSRTIGDLEDVDVIRTHNLAEGHGDTTEVDSQVGEGSTFTVTLPL